MISNLNVFEKGDSTIQTIFKLTAIIGGAPLIVDIVKALSKEKTFYSCPQCNADIEHGLDVCGNCKTPLSWNFNSTKN